MPDNSLRLLKLAEAEFPDLTEPEREVVRCAAMGEDADLAQWGPQPAEGKKHKPGGGPLRSAVVEWLCADLYAKKFVNHKGVRILKANLNTTIDLKFADIPFFLSINKCILPGFRADSARFSSSLNITNCEISGSISLLSSSISGQLRLDDTQIKCFEKTAVSADQAYMGSSVFFDNMTANSQVCLHGTTINGNISFQNSHLKNSFDIYALVLEHSTIRGTIFLDPASVTGAINAIGMSTSHELVLQTSCIAECTELDLTNAKVGRLYDTEESWPAMGNLNIDGFLYDSINCMSPTTAEQRLNWLWRMPSGQFLPQPYEQLATWFQKTGHDSEARTVRIAKEWSRFKTFKNPFKIFWWLLKFIFVGFGYKPYYAACWLIGLIVLGSFVYNRNIDLMTPSVSYNFNATEPTGGNAGLQASDYPDMNTLFYSIDVALPIVDLQQERYWMPNSSHPGGHALWLFNWFEVLFGWFLASMGIAGATGIIRKD